MSFWNGTEWVADAPPAPKAPSRAKRVAAATLEATLITSLTFGLIAGSVFAAKGGNGGKGGGGDTTISLVALDGSANHGDQIRFDVTTSASRPVVTVSCSQGGSMVYGDSKPYYWPNIWNDPGDFTLSSQAWSGGAADCTAAVKTQSNKRIVTLATTSFHVGA